MNESDANGSPWIISTTDATFVAEAIERSQQVLVVVDFWAEWCQPCKMLGPLLENLAREFDGKFVLVKADTETNPAAASQFGVQSIPAVYAVRDGKLVDYFVGLLPEVQLRGWIERMLPTPAETAHSEGRVLESSDPAGAEAAYRKAIELDPKFVPAQISLAALLLANHRLDESRAMVAQLEERGFLEPEAEKVKAGLDLQQAGANVGGVEELRAAVAEKPKDYSLQLKLAEALAAQTKYQEALDIALRLVEDDRKQTGESARLLMIDIFRLLPDDSELTTTYRRRLSAALY